MFCVHCGTKGDYRTAHCTSCGTAVRVGEAFTESDKDVIGTFVMTVLNSRERDGLLNAATRSEVARFLLDTIHAISNQNGAILFLDKLADRWPFFDQYLSALDEFLDW